MIALIIALTLSAICTAVVSIIPFAFAAVVRVLFQPVGAFHEPTSLADYAAWVGCRHAGNLFITASKQMKQCLHAGVWYTRYSSSNEMQRMRTMFAVQIEIS